MDKDEKLLKLTLNSKFKLWEKRMRAHFMAHNLWDFIEKNQQPTPIAAKGGQRAQTVDQLKAKALRDILDSLAEDVQEIVETSETTHDVYSLLKTVCQTTLYQRH